MSCQSSRHDKPIPQKPPACHKLACFTNGVEIHVGSHGILQLPEHTTRALALKITTQAKYGCKAAVLEYPFSSSSYQSTPRSLSSKRDQGRLDWGNNYKARRA